MLEIKHQMTATSTPAEGAISPSCSKANNKIDISTFDAEFDLTNVTSEGSHDIINEEVKLEKKDLNNVEMAIDATHEPALSQNA